MGQIARIKCPKCGYESTLKLGAGMRFFDPDTALSLFDKSIQEKISPLIKGKTSIGFDASFELGICEVCKKAVSVPVIRINRPGSSPHTIKPTCECGKELPTYDTNVENGRQNIPCPICKTLLKIETTSLWD